MTKLRDKTENSCSIVDQRASRDKTLAEVYVERSEEEVLLVLWEGTGELMLEDIKGKMLYVKVEILQWQQMGKKTSTTSTKTKRRKIDNTTTD